MNTTTLLTPHQWQIDPEIEARFIRYFAGMSHDYQVDILCTLANVNGLGTEVEALLNQRWAQSCPVTGGQEF